MGKGYHVVIHDVIHDDNEMGNLWATGRIFTHNLGNSPITVQAYSLTLLWCQSHGRRGHASFNLGKCNLLYTCLPRRLSGWIYAMFVTFSCSLT